MQPFDWQQTVEDILPYRDFLQFNKNDPRQYYFLGDGLLPSVCSGATVCLLVITIITTFRQKANECKHFAAFVTIPIALNVLPKIIKNVYITFTPWPDVYILFVLSTIEYTLYIIIHLNFVGSLLVLVVSSIWKIYKRKEKPPTPLCYLFPILLPSILIGIAFFNFNVACNQFPFLIYFFYMWIMTILTFVLLVAVVPIILLSSCCMKTKDEHFFLARKQIFLLYPYAAISSAPTIFITGMSLLDAIYEMLPHSSNPIGYIEIASYRIIAYHLDPICILAGILIVFPSFRRQLDVCKTGKSQKQSKPIILKTNPEISRTNSQQTVSTAPSTPRRTAVSIESQNALGPTMLNVPVDHATVEKTPTIMSPRQNNQVVAGNLHTLDPQIFPGAAPRPEQHALNTGTQPTGHVTIIMTPAQHVVIPPN